MIAVLKRRSGPSNDGPFQLALELYLARGDPINRTFGQTRQSNQMVQHCRRNPRTHPALLGKC